MPNAISHNVEIAKNFAWVLVSKSALCECDQFSPYLIWKTGASSAISLDWYTNLKKSICSYDPWIPADKDPDHYFVYSTACVEAEIDVLTGQYQLRQMDMLYDCGKR